MTSSTNPIAASGASAAATPAASTTGTNTLNMSDFLTLITTQLENQDPMNPTDSSTYLNEMAEMSTVEGISSMSTSMNSLSNSLLSSQAVSSASLVGKDVLATAGASTYTAGTSLSGAVQVPAGATAVTLNIANSGGTVVNQLAIPASAGLQGFTWSGTDASGSSLPSGTYSFAASATVAGAATAATTYLPGTVSSVSINSSTNGVTLNTAQLGAVPLSGVSQID